MKDKSFGELGWIWLLAVCVLVSANAFAQVDDPALAIAPTIISQPSDQSADYGNNASFTVAAAGTPLHYQWQKNGTNLADYANVAGARTATLTVIGAAQSDAAGYMVVVYNSSGSITS